MFGADASVQTLYDRNEFIPGKPSDRASSHDGNNIEYLFPKFSVQHPWMTAPVNGEQDYVGEDFILIAEFSEQEGPRPLIVIPKDGGANFDQNSFCVKILSVDHQSSFVEGCHLTEDTQVVMSDVEKHVHAFVHHIVLNDIQARGYVRPFCISYVTSDPRKLMACYEELSAQMRKVARLMKYGNRLVFMRDLEKHQEDLSYTKAHLLISQSRMTSSTAQGDNELLNVLNSLRQSMEEVRDILSKLKPLLNDHELEERFHHLEKLLKISVSNRRASFQSSSSLNDLDSQDSKDETKYGSFTETLSPEFSLFNKSKDQKPKLLDVSTIRGKRRFDRSLRSLHALCSWGAKDGLQRLRHVREFFKRDLSSIHIDDIDSAVLAPDRGVLSFGTDCIGANFLSPNSSMKGLSWKKPKTNQRDSQDGLASLGSVDSFKSLSSSFQSFLDEEEMQSVRSSTLDNHYSVEGISFLSDREYSKDSSSDIDQEKHGTYPPNLANNTTNCGHKLSKDLEELERTLDKTFINTSTEIEKDIHDIPVHPRTSTTNSDFDIIDTEKDVRCNIKGCYCSNICDKDVSLPGNLKKHHAKTKYLANDGELLEVGDSTITIESNSSFCNYSLKGVDKFNDNRADHCDSGEETDLMAESRESVIHSSDSSKYGSCFEVLKVEKDETVTVPQFEKTGSISKHSNSCDNDEGNLIGINEVFLPHSELSINEVSEDLVEEGEKQFERVCDKVDQSLRSKLDKQLSESETRSDKSPSVEMDNDVIHNTEIDAKTAPGSGDFSAILDSEKTTPGYTVNIDKYKPFIGHANGFWRGDSHTPCSSSDKSIEEEGRHRRIRPPDKKRSKNTQIQKKMETNSPIERFDRFKPDTRFLSDVKPFVYVLETLKQVLWQTVKTQMKCHIMQHFIRVFTICLDHGLLKVLTSYNNLQHVIYSLLSGRPVIVMGTTKYQAIMRELLQALNVFVPVVPGCDHVTLLCQLRQLKVVDVHKFLLRGIIRSEKKSLEYIIPQSLRRYITLIDVEKSLISCVPYQGSLLNFISAIYNKKKVFKSEQALHTFIQMCLMEISTKAFNFYHCMYIPDMESNYSGVTLTRKSSMLELSADKFLNKTGLLTVDTRIIKHLAEIVKIQQIEDEFKCRSLTDCPVYPFSVAYNTVQTFRC